MMNDRIDYYIEDYSDDKVAQMRSKDIEKMLDQLCLYYEKEKTFENLIDQRHLRYDYYIPKLNLCIEYDGEQHFREIKFHKDFKYTDYVRAISRDRRKDDYAINNDIHLMRIPFWSTKADVFERLIEFMQGHELRLNSNAEHYLKALVEDSETDLNNIKMNQLYDDYTKMLKELKVDNIVNYELFKFYLISTYHLKFIKTARVNQKWVDIYSQLEKDEFESYANKIFNEENNSAYSFALATSLDDILNHTVKDVKGQYEEYCETNDLNVLGGSKFNHEIATHFGLKIYPIQYEKVELGSHHARSVIDYLDQPKKQVKAWIKE